MSDTKEHESVSVGEKRKREDIEYIDVDKLEKIQKELNEFLDKNHCTDDKSVLKAAPVEGLKPHHTGVAISIIVEDGTEAEALIKQSDLSDTERKWVELVLSTQDTDFSTCAQVWFYRNIRLFFDKFDVGVLTDNYKELRDLFRDLETGKEFPFSNEEMVDIQFDMIKGSKNWVRTNEQEQINKFTMKEGYLCLTFFGWR